MRHPIARIVLIVACLHLSELAVGAEARLIECASCLTETDYTGAAATEVWSAPIPGSPASQKYDIEVVVVGSHLDRLYVVKYQTFTEMEGMWVYQTPVRISTTRVDVGSGFTKDELFIGAQVAVYSADSGFILTIPGAGSYDQQGNVDTNWLAMNGNPAVVVTNAMNTGLVTGATVKLAQVLKASAFTKGAISFFGISGVGIFVKYEAPDGTYGYYKLTGSLSSISAETIAYVRSDGTLVVLKPEEMKNLPKDDPLVQAWLNDPANAQYASTSGLTGPALAAAVFGPMSFGLVGTAATASVDSWTCWQTPDGVACRKNDDEESN